MKNKKIVKDGDVSNTHAENTQYLSFLYEDFLAKQTIKDPKSKMALDMKEFLTHACAHYKALLELPPVQFWSTIAFNAYLNRALDSFLSFARRWHFSILDVSIPNENVWQESYDFEDAQIKKHLHLYYNELYRVIFNVYLRLSSDPHDKSITNNINYKEIIYENWVFDIPKFLDICAIYAENDADGVKKILQNVFNLEPGYYDDFLEFVTMVTDDLIPGNLKIINRHRKRDDLNAEIEASDTAEKERVLIILYDIMYHLKMVVLYFPRRCLEELYYDKKFLLILENTYIVLNVCYKTWRVSREKKDVLTCLARRINNMIFRICERIFNQMFNDLLMGANLDKVAKNKRLWTQLNDYMNQTGKTQGNPDKSRKMPTQLNEYLQLKKGQKKSEEPVFKFLRKLLKFVDLGVIFQRAPAGVLKEEEIENYQVLIMILKDWNEELRKKKRGGEAIAAGEDGKKKVDDQEKESEKVAQEEAKKEDSMVAKEVAEKEEKKAAEKKPEDKETEGTREAIRIIEMTFGKKKKELNIFDDEEIRDAMETTLKLAQTTSVYEDEYDDTLEMYEEDRLRIGDDQHPQSSDEDRDPEDVEIEGKPEDGGKQGGRKPWKKRENEGERGYQDRGGYQGKGQYEDRGNQDRRGGDRRYPEKSYQEKNQQEKSGYYQEKGPYQDKGGYQEKSGYYKDRNYEKGGHQDKGGYPEKRNYPEKAYQEKGDQEKGYQYKGNQDKGREYQEDNRGYKGNRPYQDKWEDDRGDNRGGYRGEKGYYQQREENYQGGGGRYRDNQQDYVKKGQEDSYEEGKVDTANKRDAYFKNPEKMGTGFQKSGEGGFYDQKKNNTKAYQNNQKYKKKEFVPKNQ